MRIEIMEMFGMSYLILLLDQLVNSELLLQEAAALVVANALVLLG